MMIKNKTVVQTIFLILILSIVNVTQVSALTLNPSQTGTGYRQILKDDSFTAGAFSETGWISHKYSWGGNSLDAADTITYENGYVLINCHDDASYKEDKNEAFFIRQNLGKNYFYDKSNLTLDVIVDYTMQKTAGSAAMSLEETYFTFCVYFNTELIATLESYYIKNLNQPAWGASNVAKISVDLSAPAYEGFLDKFYCTENIDITVQVWVYSICYETTLQTVINSVKVCGFVSNTPPPANISILTPVENAVVTKGTYTNVTWNFDGVIPNVNLFLIDALNHSVAEIIDYNVTNTGNYMWLVNPRLPSSSYYIMINMTDDSVSGQSKTFTLIDGNYDLTTTEFLQDTYFNGTGFQADKWHGVVTQFDDSQGSVDDSDYIEYNTEYDVVRMVLHDDDLDSVDLEEVCYLSQNFSGNYISDFINNSVKVLIMYRFYVNRGNDATWKAEISDISLKFGFNGKLNWMMESYVATEKVQDEYDSGIVTKAWYIPVKDFMDYPYKPENVNFTIALYGKQISNIKTITADIYVATVIANTSVCTNITRPQVEIPYTPKSDLSHYQYLKDINFEGKSFAIDWTKTLGPYSLGTVCDASLSAGLDFDLSAPGINTALAFDVNNNNIEGVFAITDVGNLSINLDAFASLDLAGGQLNTYKDIINAILWLYGKPTMDEFKWTAEYKYNYEKDVHLGPNKILFNSFTYDFYENRDLLFNVSLWDASIGEFGFVFKVGVIIKPYIVIDVSLDNVEIEIGGTATDQVKKIGPNLKVTKPTEFGFQLPYTNKEGASLYAKIKSATMKYTFAGIGFYLGLYVDVDTYIGRYTELFDYQMSIWLDSEIVNTKIFWNQQEPPDILNTNINGFELSTSFMGVEQADVQPESVLSIEITPKVEIPESGSGNSSGLIIVGIGIVSIVVISIVVKKKKAQTVPSAFYR